MLPRVAVVLLLVGWTAVLSVAPVEGVRFVLDRQECFQQHVETAFDRVFASFVIIKADSPWSFSRIGVDVTVCNICPRSLGHGEYGNLCERPLAIFALCVEGKAIC